MILNTFAPPFKLVGGYFVAGFLFLIGSLFVFCISDFDTLLAFETAAFFHIFLIGFVMSIIIGSLYQLTSVILEKEFFSIKFCFVNLFIYVVAIVLFVCGMRLSNVGLMHAGGGLLTISFCYFIINYLLSFIGVKRKSFAVFALFVAGLFLLCGILLGFLLLAIVSGAVQFDFMNVLKFHIFSIIGAMYFIILGSSSILIPMFALSHNYKFTFYKIASFLYFVAFCMLWNQEISNIILACSFLCFVIQSSIILKNRVRKAFDYWNLNIILSFLSLILAILFYFMDDLGRSIYCICFGFLYAFIVGHAYKILPFLIWYHYVSPFVGKKKIPMLEEMILKNTAYIALFCNGMSIVFFIFKIKYLALAFMFASVVLVLINVFNMFKFVNFGEKNG